MLELESLINKPEDLLDVLPQDQKIIIEDLLEQGKSNDEVAQIWLSATTAPNVDRLKTDVLQYRKLYKPMYKSAAADQRVFDVLRQASDEEGKEDTALYDRIKKEIEDFICNKDRYEDERSAFKEIIKKGIKAGVAYLVLMIAPMLKITVTVLRPIVVLILNTILEMGTNIWCSIRKEQTDSPVEA